jgi:hypothetical protein
VSGTGNSLEEILVPFANAGLALLPILSFCTNVAVGEPDIELGFDNTEGTLERDYFQTYIPSESGVLHVCRHINIEATTDVVRELIVHKESERLRRGVNQYRVALALGD